MTIHAQLAIVAAVTVYVVGVSGFTQSWRSALARWLHTTEEELRPLPPFDCERCASFWACIAWALIQGQLGLVTVAEAAAASLLSLPLQQILVFIREGLTAVTSKLIEKL